MDETAAALYRNLEGDLGERLRQVLKTQDGASYMELENGRCPMWRQDGLCRIQAELDHEALCQVCREYPRMYLDYGDFVQWGLELSCPEAARLIFQGIQAEIQTVPGGTEGEYDPELMSVLQKSRGEILEFWENENGTLPEKLAVTLLFAHQVQDALDGGEYRPLSWQQQLALAKGYGETGDIQLILDFFRELEILTDAWKTRLSAPKMGFWDVRLRHFAVYLIRRFWFQAVWDYDLVCRVKFLVSACVLVNALGGDPVRTAQLFSKEIENDPDNREAILDAAYSHRAFTDVNLLSLLLA